MGAEPWGPVVVQRFMTLLVSLFLAQSADYAPLEIEVAVPMPDVQIFVSRANLNDSYDLALEQDFLDAIVESADHQPF